MTIKKFVLVKTYQTKQAAKQAAPRSAAIIKHNDGRFIIKQNGDAKTWNYYQPQKLGSIVQQNGDANTWN